ncbi:MAG: hypothetical protein HZC55_28555 [Verrucomicrobia bacterium]|nr:hypothetical protein [Verrucomicrobiota bacterium]
MNLLLRVRDYAKKHCPITCLVAVCAAASLSGCVALGPVGAVGAVYSALMVTSEVVRDTDQTRRHTLYVAALERELRSLLPAFAPAATGAPTEPPGEPRPPRVSFSIDGDALPESAGRSNVPGLSITVSGEITPPTARLLAEGARRIAWRRADAIGLTIYGLPGASGETIETPPVGIMDPYYALRGLKKLLAQHFDPHAEVRRKLFPLVPPTATGRTGLWGQASYGEFILHPGPRLEVSGGFSPALAEAFVATSQAAFPQLAITVYRDETRARSGWVKLASYQPASSNPPELENPIH